jgi:putative endonuclease
MDADSRRDALARGAEAEGLVAAELALHGWRVLARNWHGGGAEVDLIVERDGALRFVEVKARLADDPSGLEAITADKQRRLVRAAEAWLAGAADVREAAFVVAVVTMHADGRWAIELLDDAFDG